MSYFLLRLHRSEEEPKRAERQDQADGRGAAYGSLDYSQYEKHVNIVRETREKDDEGAAAHRPLIKEFRTHPGRQSPPEGRRP